MLIRAFLLLAVLTTSNPAQQPTKVRTLEECIRLAEGVPNAASVAEQDRRIADREVTKSRAASLPQSQVLSGFIYNSPHIVDRSSPSFIALNSIREYGVIGTVTQEFDTSGKLRGELQRARSNQEAARTSFEITRRDLRHAVTIAYYRLLLTRHLAAVIRQALQESRNFEQRTRLLFDNGEAARADVVKASAQVASLEQQLKAAELESTVANQELAAFWTKDVTDEVAVVDILEEQPPAPDREDGSAAPYMRRMEFKLFDVQQQGFQAEARIARSAVLPQLGFVFQYGIDSTAMRIGDRGYAAFFNLRIPVFDWFHARSEKEQFNLRAEQVENNRVIAERVFSRDYQNALTRVKQFFEQINLTRQQVKLAEEDLRLSRLKYDGGEGLALDVVTAQNQLAQARSNYYTAMANYLSARADLEVASGLSK